MYTVHLCQPHLHHFDYITTALLLNIYPLDHHNDGHNCSDQAKDTGAHSARGALESLDVLAITSASRNTRADGARWAGITVSGGWMGRLVWVLGHRDDCHGFDRNKGDS